MTSGAGGGTRHPRYGEHAGTSMHAPGGTPSAPDLQVEAEVAVVTTSVVSSGEGRPLLPPRPFRFHTDLRFPNDPDWLTDRARTTTITVKGGVL